jgi:hypothetical protein
MKTQYLCLALTLSSLLHPSIAVAAVKPPGLANRTVLIDCSRGDSIARALTLPANRLVIKISGVCVGDIMIDRDRVVLEGISPDATLEGDPEIPGPALAIFGASEVNLIDLTVRGGDSSGVVVRRNGETRLERVRIIDTPVIGLLVDTGSSALLVDSVVRNHQIYGAAVFGSSGLTVQGSNEFSGNGRIGLLMSSGASLHTQGGGAISADDNGILGIVLQSGAAGLFPSTLVRRNGVAGVQVTFSASFSSIGLDNSFSDNGAFGVLLFDAAQFSAAGSFRDNAVAGIQASEGSVVSVATDIPATIAGSPIGLSLDGAIGTFNNVDINSAAFTFGTRVTFGPAVTVTSLSCDLTALVRGSISCPSPAAAASGPSTQDGANSIGSTSADTKRLFQLPPS